MKRLGDGLMLLGAALGGAVAIAMLLHVGIPNLPWLVLVGLTKLTLVSSLGLMAAGAVIRRLAVRADQRLLQSGSDRAGTYNEQESAGGPAV